VPHQAVPVCGFYDVYATLALAPWNFCWPRSHKFWRELAYNYEVCPVALTSKLFRVFFPTLFPSTCHKKSLPDIRWFFSVLVPRLSLWVWCGSVAWPHGSQKFVAWWHATENSIRSQGWATKVFIQCFRFQWFRFHTPLSPAPFPSRPFPFPFPQPKFNQNTHIVSAVATCTMCNWLARGMCRNFGAICGGDLHTLMDTVAANFCGPLRQFPGVPQKRNRKLSEISRGMFNFRPSHVDISRTKLYISGQGDNLAVGGGFL